MSVVRADETAVAASRALASRAAGDEDARWEERRAEAESKRLARTTHHSRDVWTKAPHGGAYRNEGAATRRGYDALVASVDGKPLPVEAGYERPQRALTTNFVGNHMTQGAIDLVQSALERAPKGAERAARERYQRWFHPPKRLTPDEAAATEAATPPPAASDPPDLALLRRALREGRRAKQPGDGRLFAPLDAVSIAPSPASDAPTPSHATPPEDLAAESATSEAAGDYARCLDLCTAALAALPPTDAPQHLAESKNAVASLALELALRQARSLQALGRVREAAEAAWRAATLAQGDPAGASRALAVAGRCEEAAERFDAAADAYAASLAAWEEREGEGEGEGERGGAPPPAALGDAMGRCRRLGREQQRRRGEEADGCGAAVPPSVPRRRAVPSFNDRDKSGAVF